MRKCVLLRVEEDGGQEVVAIVILEDGKLEFAGEPLAVEALKRVPAARVSELQEGERATASTDPVAWFEALPWTYNGARLRAQMIE